jgi:hypothetical protein
MKKLLTVAAAGALALVMTSCFTLQGFSVLATSVQPGGKTKAQFVLRPAFTTKDKAKQFIMVGVPNSGALTVGKAIWGTNGKFGGPVPMSYTANLPTLVINEGACNSNGLDLANVTGITWKGFLTANVVGDRGRVDTKVIVQAIVKAIASATESNYTVIGVTGRYQDQDSNGPDPGDLWSCTGTASVSLYVK